MQPPEMTILIIEDGDEYLENLQAFLAGPRYVQTRSARQALEILKDQRVDLAFLDMRFDRSAAAELLGEVNELLDGFALTDQEAWSFIKNNQGLYIYRALRQAGHGQLPILISYDFTNEAARWSAISGDDPRVDWIPDSATPELIERKIRALVLKVNDIS